MQYKTFVIPADSSPASEEALNLFLRSERIISVQKEFISSPSPQWCFLVEYMNDGTAARTGAKIDYMKVLTSEEFAVFSRLREVRKKIATEEHIPAYAVFTDEQLSKLVTQKVDSIEKMQKISGIGQAKAEKFGKSFLDVLKNPKESGENKENHAQNQAENQSSNDKFDLF